MTMPASPGDRAQFHELVESDSDICQNCFAALSADESSPCSICVADGADGRTWGERSPLPKNGARLSTFRLLAALRDRFDERGYDVDWSAWKTQAADLKDRHPSQDRAVFARIVAATVTTDD